LGTKKKTKDSIEWVDSFSSFIQLVISLDWMNGSGSEKNGSGSEQLDGSGSEQLEPAAMIKSTGIKIF